MKKKIASSLHSSDSSFSADEEINQTALSTEAHGRNHSTAVAPLITTNQSFDLSNHNIKKGKNLIKRNPSESSNDSQDVQHHKLTREDSERPIASEKIKKKSNHGEKEVCPNTYICIVILFKLTNVLFYSMVMVVRLLCLSFDITQIKFVNRPVRKRRSIILQIVVMCKLIH